METNGLFSEFSVDFPAGVKLGSVLLATEAADVEHRHAGEHLEKLRDNARQECLRWRPVKQHPRAHSIDFAREMIGILLERASSARPALSFLNADDREWVLDNVRLLRTALRDVLESRRSFSEQPHVESWDGRVLPRPCVLARGFLRAADFHFDAEELASYLSGWQEHHRIEMGELWALKPALQLSILDEIAALIAPLLEQSALSLHVVTPQAGVRIGPLITNLRLIGEADWKVLFEQISTVDQILRRDPAGAYPRMDYESRDLYRSVIAELASHSMHDETEIVEIVLSLAETASKHETSDPRVLERETHVGYYLLDGGLPHLRRHIGYRHPLAHRLHELLPRFPNSFYLVGIEIVTFVIVILILGGLPRFAPIVAGFFFLFIPASQAAVELMNTIVTSLLPARRLPKLDFSEGIPDEYKTMVAVPSLLLHAEQVKDLVHRLEVRYLANRHPNLFFALVTDGPDADQRFDEKEALTGYCSDLILDLNHKYAGSDNGPFFLFHRYRTFNPCENVWMGWERKRGKLLELNNLLRGAGDSFPVKVGDLSVLPQICFVITLDSDTQLPRDVAHRLIGTLAHPLNRAIVDPLTNTVTNGYGILQPRIGISVHSAIRSRLASIYSGQTGFDIYTRAISDVYQDLYGEGIFTGKGIYEVDVFRQVLEHRFPCNALLSHDLIEGAYTRAALVSDIELIDDYPSHFSAYSRRKHRWVRGDWQIMQWLSPRVPDFDGRMVPNPTTVISRWKIFDNLRRSLVDPGLFFLLLAGWLFLPGPPWYWTLAAISLLLLPTYGQAFMSLVRISNWRRPASLLRSTGSAFAKGHLNVLLTFIFLMHQALVTMDAIVRTIVRHRITRRRLLEWETAAEAEDAAKKRPVDIYLAWTPWIALGITLVLAFFRPEVCVYAAPILLLWTTGRSLARWLSLQNTTPQIILKSQQQKLLRGAALRTWRYFSENSGPAENWLVPDNIQEFPAIVAHRISPTNLGLLLNARQAACALGYITLPEFVRQTTETLSVARGLAKHNGHFYNWYDTKTLQPLDPLFISAVDSGNLVASLWTLKQGCLSLIDEPIFPQCLWQSMLDYVRILDELDPATTSRLNGIVRELGKDGLKWLCELDAVEQEAKAVLDASNEAAHWWAAEFVTRIAAVRDLADNFAPWFRLPDTDVLRQWVGDPRKCLAGLTPAQVPVLAAQFRIRLKTEAPGDLRDLSDQLSRVSEKSEAVLVDLRRLASEAARMADQMDFRVVYNRRKKLLSVGYDVVAQRLHPACYDLLASEARTAAFVAIAKGDIPQESWFHLGRTQRMYKGRRILLSWTGTMFEYLMPTLWMRTYPRTILDESVRAVIEIQQIHCRKKSTPWGISESATAETDSQGCYQYRAFGLPMLALKRAKMRAHVISPYATFLALEAHPVAATRNLHAIWNQGWVGKYGFYEAIDFQESVSGTLEAKVVKSWMAHHHAMSLMAVSNRLRPSLFQQYFHAEPQVIATELLLHEKLPASLKVESEPDVEPAVSVAQKTPAAAA